MTPKQQHHQQLGGSPETLAAIENVDISRAADAALDAELREVGCPYLCHDFRARIWLDGFQACLKQQVPA